MIGRAHRRLGQAVVTATAALALVACQTSAPPPNPMASIRMSQTSPQLDALFSAERAFARDAYAIGVRPAFLKNLADDAIVFAPGPVRYAEFVKAHPASGDPMATLLEWGPQVGAVSRAGDLGFTTGPSRTSKRAAPNGPASHGYFFSIWSRESGAWRVILDAGVTLDAPPPQEGASNLRVPMFEGPMATLDAAGRQASLDALMAMERGTRLVGPTPDGGAALRDWVVASTRWVRDNAPALTGRELVAWLNAQPAGRIDFAPEAGRVAQSDDLAYTRGTFTRGGATPSEGWYVHVWQRDRGRVWRLIAAISLPKG